MERGAKLYVVQFLSVFLVCLIIYCVYVLECTRDNDTHVEHIALMKTHSCGLAALQNILFRANLGRNLSIIVAKNGEKSIDRWGMPLKNYVFSASNPGKYTVLPYSSIHDSTGVKRKIPQTAYITIIQDPVIQFSNMYKDYSLSNMFDGKSLVEVLRDERLRRDLQNARDTKGKIGPNQMAYDLGFRWTEPASDEKIQEFIEQLDEDFTLVLISERFIESVALLLLTIKWSFGEVLLVDFDNHHDYSLSQEDVDELRKLNYIDVKVYNHFLQKFTTQIQEHGERVQDLAHLLTKYSNYLRALCDSLHILGLPEMSEKCEALKKGQVVYTKPVDKKLNKNV